MSRSRNRRGSCLLQLIPRGKLSFLNQTCCDDDNVRAGGNTNLPEQHFFLQQKKENVVLDIDVQDVCTASIYPIHFLDAYIRPIHFLYHHAHNHINKMNLNSKRRLDRCNS